VLLLSADGNVDITREHDRTVQFDSPARPSPPSDRASSAGWEEGRGTITSVYERRGFRLWRDNYFAAVRPPSLAERYLFSAGDAAEHRFGHFVNTPRPGQQKPSPGFSRRSRHTYHLECRAPWTRSREKGGEVVGSPASVPHSEGIRFHDGAQWVAAVGLR